MKQGKKKHTKEMATKKANEVRKKQAVKRIIQLKATKFIRDPIHDLIRIDEKVILDIIDTPPMQRLKRIKQLGLANLVYPSAVHTRFSHSLGAYHLSGRMLNQLSTISRPIPKYDRLVVQLAALMHDLGHGPFSHMFERVTKDFDFKSAQDHEDWTIEIIKKNASVKRALNGIDSKLGTDVCAIIGNIYTPNYYSSVVSSQVDVDRFDYMLRDSYMTGVHYGRFDLSWMLRNLSLDTADVVDLDNKKVKFRTVVVDAKRGLSSLEDYLLGLFNLYKHVYFHRTVCVAEEMMQKVLMRAFTVAVGDTVIGVKHPVFRYVQQKKKIPLSVYLSLDDNTIMSWLSHWAGAKKGDTVLRKLSVMLYERDLFKSFELQGLSSEQVGTVIEKIKSVLRKKRLPEDNFLVFSERRRAAYSTFLELLKIGKQQQEIYYKNDSGEILKYSEMETTNNQISQALRELTFIGDVVCVPRNVASDVDAIIKEFRK